MKTAPRTLILVCRGPECGDKKGSATVHHELAAELSRTGAAGQGVTLGWQSCFGQCRRGINVMVREMRPGEDLFFLSFKPGGDHSALYHGVGNEDARRIILEHVVGGKVIEDLKKRNP